MGFSLKEFFKVGVNNIKSKLKLIATQNAGLPTDIAQAQRVANRLTEQIKGPINRKVKAFNEDVRQNLETTDGMFKVLYRCIDEIHYGDDVYHRIDISDKDIEGFVEQLTTEQFQKITNFFDTMPKLRHVVEVTNPKTNIKSEVVLEGLQSFLG